MSREIKHTPGPWIIDPQYVGDVQTPNMKTIASCWNEHYAGRTVDVTGILECSLEESAANARLIAAAPDLLKALKDLRTAYYGPQGGMSADEIEACRDAWACAEAAISKAEALNARDSRG